MSLILLTSFLTCNQLLDIAKTIESSDVISEYQKTEIILKLRKITPSCPIITREYKS